MHPAGSSAAVSLDGIAHGTPALTLLPASDEGPSSIILAQRLPNPTGAMMSFAEAVKTSLRFPGKSKSFNAFKSPLPQSFENIHAGFPSKEEIVEVKELTSLFGRPCVYLSDEELSTLAKPLELSLIGKFSQGRPKWLSLNKYFMDLRLRGAYKIASLDSRHFVIHLNTFEDYTKIFSKPVSTIKGHVVKYFKWTLDFDVNNEPPITPIWIAMSLLKMSMFTQNMIFSIAKAYGKPLLIDPSTALGNNPGVARVLVEMDVLEDHPKDVWIGNEVSGYAQVVEIENKPKYCSHCRKYGHMMNECYMKYPELNQKQRKYEWQAKDARPNVNPKKNAVPVCNPPEISNTSDGESPSGDLQHNRPPFHEEQRMDLGKRYWDEYKAQMRIEEEARNASKDASLETEKTGDVLATANSKENRDVQEGTCESIGNTSEDKEPAVAELERARRMAQEVIFQVTEKIYEECYNKAFNDECEGQVLNLQVESERKHTANDSRNPNLGADGSDQGIPLVAVSSPASDCTLVPNTNKNLKMLGSNKNLEKTIEMAVDSRNLTELNIFDMNCMGFEPVRAESGHEGNMEDTDFIPPHSKNRRNSWGDEDTNVWTMVNHKRGKKKKGNASTATSPRKTRGRTKELRLGRLASEEDSQ